MKYETSFTNQFKQLKDDYQLNYKVLSDEEIALIGPTFALVFLIHFDEVSLNYVCRDMDGLLICYDVWSYFLHVFADKDREELPEYNSAKERIDVSFLILSRGLPRHWSFILNGDRQWLEDYKTYELASLPKKVSGNLRDSLNSYI
ncbi:hypothetical protein IA929_04090 [Listeria seeligeri]|uniref:hypothetical protein n=1 Tax=Listeria seeligeri TaxID=1640 RepID=UPI001888D1BD|nr:hypothetical protein [Listeria seeligeri]MBF2599181.1 hypothetical protein [Listeria seeligeri]